jgi:epoxyqueuosine reductase
MVSEKKDRLLLHACCAPCTTLAAEELMKDYNVSVFFFNPNIFPSDEYDKRLGELRKFSKKMKFSVFEGSYNSYDWLDFIKGHEGDKENGERCRLCFLFRLETAAKFARDEGFDFFSTTLNVNPFKNSDDIRRVGDEAGKKFGVKFVLKDFNAWTGYNRSLELSKKYDLYRQNYCGCVFSLNNRVASPKL